MAAANREWVSVIRLVRTPLAFFTLLVLATEGILVGLAVRVSGFDLTLLLVGMILLLFALVLAVIATQRQARGTTADSDTKNRKYDVFIASVLAGFEDDARLLAEKKTALAVAKAFEEECHFTVYYAGKDVKSVQDFDGSHIGARADLDALRDSRHFIMIYPQKITSSVLFEAGYAYQRCETSTFFVRNASDLPYLMRRLPEVHSNFVRTLTYKDSTDIVRMIKAHREHLFDWS